MPHEWNAPQSNLAPQSREQVSPSRYAPDPFNQFVPLPPAGPGHAGFPHAAPPQQRLQVPHYGFTALQGCAVATGSDLAAGAVQQNVAVPQGWALPGLFPVATATGLAAAQASQRWAPSAPRQYQAHKQHYTGSAWPVPEAVPWLQPPYSSRTPTPQLPHTFAGAPRSDVHDVKSRWPLESEQAIYESRVQALQEQHPARREVVANALPRSGGASGAVAPAPTRQWHMGPGGEEGAGGGGAQGQTLGGLLNQEAQASGRKRERREEPPLPAEGWDDGQQFTHAEFLARSNGTVGAALHRASRNGSTATIAAAAASAERKPRQPKWPPPMPPVEMRWNADSPGGAAGVHALLALAGDGGACFGAERELSSLACGPAAAPPGSRTRTPSPCSAGDREAGEEEMEDEEDEDQEEDEDEDDEDEEEEEGPPVTLTAAEVRWQAKAEGLTLLRSDTNATGFHGVSKSKKYAIRPYLARVRCHGRDVNLGSYATAEEAALAYARGPTPQRAREAAHRGARHAADRRRRPASPANPGWIQCNECQKWRRVASVPEEGTVWWWTCKENPDARYARCGVPQELSDAAIDAELARLQRGLGRAKGGARAAPTPETPRAPRALERWACGACTMLNAGSARRCKSCAAPRGGEQGGAAAGAPAASAPAASAPAASAPAASAPAASAPAALAGSAALPCAWSSTVGGARARLGASARPARRNSEPGQILTHGFVECRRLLPRALCAKLAAEPVREAEGISNASQLGVSDARRAEVGTALARCAHVSAAVDATFGTAKFRLTALKLVRTEPGAEPQIPHADDHCNRELFGVVHLRRDQAPTECAEYDAAANYPTGVLVQCEACAAWFPLPDAVARRRDHLAPGRVVTCADAALACAGGEEGPMGEAMEEAAAEEQGEVEQEEQEAQGGANEQEQEEAQGEAEEEAKEEAEGEAEETEEEEDDSFAAGTPPRRSNRRSCPRRVPLRPHALAVAHAFAPLVDDPRALIDAMAPCGASPDVGDGVLALPTLVHRGPGCGGGSGYTTGRVAPPARLVLFFSVAPVALRVDTAVLQVFSGARAEAEDVGAYDEETQIHAGWLLWRADKLLKPRKQAIMHAYKQLGFDLAKGIAESRGGRRAPFTRKRKRAKTAKRNRDGTFTPGGA